MKNSSTETMPQAMILNRKGPKILIVLAIMVGVIIVLAALALFFSRDISSADDSKLQLSKVEVPESQNAFYDLRGISVDTEDAGSIGALLIDDKASSQAIQLLVDKYKQQIDTLVTASSKPYFQDPKTSDPSTYSQTTPLSSISQARQLSRLSILRARLATLNGDTTAANKDIKAAVAMGSLFARNRGPLIGYLMGLAIMKDGYTAANSLKLDKTAYASLADTHQEAFNAIAAEYLMGSKGLTDLSEWETGVTVDGTGATSTDHGFAKYDHFPLSGFYYQPNRTRQMAADMSLASANYASSSCSKTIAPPKTSVDPIPRGKSYFTRNYIGLTILSLSLPSLEVGVKTKRCEVESLAAKI